MSCPRVTLHSATVATFAICCTFSITYPAAAQSKPNGNTKTQKQLDIAAARADRKALVGANMHLTQEQATRFWPLYDAYEAKIDRIDAPCSGGQSVRRTLRDVHRGRC